MTLTPEEKSAIERAVVRGWPALETTVIDGWLARWSSGGSVRANSVAALEFCGTDFDAALQRVVGFYRQRGGVPRFTITDVVVPDRLDARLEQRGWQRHGEHVTFAKDVTGRDAAPHHGTPGIRFEMHAKPTHAWSEVYLAGLSPDSQGIALRLVEGTPAPRVFVTGLRDGVVIASGLSVLDGRLASVQCMATVAAARRTGAATAILSAIESHALANGVCRLYLQTDAANTGAISVYTRYGFSLAGHYHTRVFPVSG